jgi:hypothetical protein
MLVSSLVFYKEREGPENESKGKPGNRMCAGVSQSKHKHRRGTSDASRQAGHLKKNNNPNSSLGIEL